MKILGIETSSRICSVAICEDNYCQGEISIVSKITHSVSLIPNIDWLLKSLGLSIKEIDGLAVSIGPGSFIGLRIGIATAKGLAQALNKPLVGVSSLEALVHQAIGYAGFICPIVDGKRKEIFWALYRRDRQKAIRVSKFYSTSAEALCSRIAEFKSAKDEPIFFIGDAILTYGEEIRERLKEKALFTSSVAHFPKASTIAYLGYGLISKGEYKSGLNLFPLYIRLPDAVKKIKIK